MDSSHPVNAGSESAAPGIVNPDDDAFAAVEMTDELQGGQLDTEHLDAGQPEPETVRTAVVLREVIERQLVACRTLSVQITYAATDITAAAVESPARVISAVRDGATLPEAIGQTGELFQDAAAEAGSRLRAAVGNYVNSQSGLSDALIVGTAEIAGAVARAHGAVAAGAFDAAFTVATVVSKGGDIRDAAEHEWQDLLTSAASARDEIDDALSTAGHALRDAVPS
ncbi:MAG: hypothetical protein WBB07_15220 [Mycobacterium sp.]